MAKVTLFYAHDPMCSWCWGFAETWDALTDLLLTRYPDRLQIKTLLGGLAPDSDQSMPESMQRYLKQTWAAIEQRIPGTRFNYDFWSLCQPRRSTWPACRAVIAARKQGRQYGAQMSRSIQHAYYLEARNPSERQTLIDIAVALGLDPDRFAADLDSAETRKLHQQEMQTIQAFGIQGFPALVLEIGQRGYPVQIDYQSADSMAARIGQFMNSAGTMTG